jgi:hypothetical protein
MMSRPLYLEKVQAWLRQWALLLIVEALDFAFGCFEALYLELKPV